MSGNQAYAHDTAVATPYDPPSTATSGGKKKNKKKGKAKATDQQQPAPAPNGSLDEHGVNGAGHTAYDSAVTLDEADDFDQLDYGFRPGVQQQQQPPGSTQLFSNIPGVFDATGGILPQVPNLTHQDLLNTANELYRRMEDPQFATDDAYWTSLPVHLRNFIRNALPLAPAGGLPQIPSSAVKDSQAAMYAMAQQIVSAANQGQMGMGQNFANGMLVGNASIFPGGVATAAGLGKQPMNGLQHHGVMNGDQREMPGAMPGGRDGTVSLDGDDYESEVESIGSAKSLILDASAAGNGQGQESAGKKKKKKKKKGAIDPPVPAVPAEQMRAPAVRPQQPATVNPARPPAHQIPPAPQRTLAPPQPTYQQPPPATRPAATLPPNPQPAHPAPPPSSRAAGKQPMLNNAVPPAAAQPPPQAGNPPAPARSARSAGKAPLTNAPAHQHAHNPGHNHAAHNHPPSKASSIAGAPAAKGKGTAPAPPPKLWQPSSNEERERIKEFWLALNQDERQNLVKVEKDAVLRKMKEQQRHSCGCAVCGRKRSAIEGELETLYDAYYEELETYAHHQSQYASAPGGIPPPLGPGPFPGSVEVDANGQIVRPDHLAPVRRNNVSHDAYHDAQQQHKGVPPHDGLDSEEEEEEYDDDEDYEDEEEEDVGSDEAEMGEDDDEDLRPRPGAKKAALPPPVQSKVAAGKAEDGAASDAVDFFSFPSSLKTMKGGILTVADDLMKNDGAKFFEMMEQLAERRMLREEMAIQGIEEDDLDDEDDLDEGDEEEEDEDEEEEDEDPILTEAERMEEGRRMFQIFAARMFEQRVLEAYRQKSADEKRQQFLRELEEEENERQATEAKKAKENQKKKDKKKQQKQAKEDEKAKREAAAAAEAAALKAKQEAAEKAAAKKREEEKAKREAERRAKLEEAQRREEEKRKRAAEERERELEAQRKKKEKEEQARAEREAKEKERKAKEEKDRADREAKERQDKADKERAAQEAEAKKEAARREREAREEREKEAQAQALAQAQARLLSQQRAAAAKSAAIAQQQSKLQKPAKANAAAAVKTAKPPAKAPTSTLSTPASAPAVVSAGPSASSSRSGSPPKVSTMPTPNVRPPPTRVPSAGVSPSTHQPLPQQVMGHQGPFVPGAPGGPPGMLSGGPMSAPQYSMGRPAMMNSPGASPPVVAAASGSGAAQGNAQPSPFPSQVPGYSPNARAPATSPGGYGSGGLPTFAGGMQPSPVFGQAMPGANLPSVSPAASRSFLPDNGNITIDNTLIPGMRNVGIGHPTKSQRSMDDIVFSTGGIGSSRVPSDQDQSVIQPPGHEFRSFKRPDPIGAGPIEPIGRPRPQLSSSGLDMLDEAGPSTSTSRRASPPFAEKVLGSAALLADDDDVIGPAPRRVSNNASLGAGWSTGAIGSSSGQWGASAFSASPGIWGGASSGVPSGNSNWPTSAGPFNQASRFDGSKSAGPGPIGHMPPSHAGGRGFSAPGMGPPGGMPFAPQQGVNIFSPPPQSAGPNQHQQQHPHH